MARPHSTSMLLASEPERWRAKTCLMVIALVVMGWLVVAWPWLSGEVTIPYDAKAHFQAQLAFLAQSLHRGESPFWLPYAFAGHPQIADPQSLIFSPFFFLALATPNPSFQQADALTFGMLLFGALAIIGYGYDRRWHPAAAVLAALVFCFGAGAGWRIQHVGQVLSLSYFPWALWMLDRALLRRSLGYGALSGLFAALMLLNRDQVAYLSALILAGRVLFDWLEGSGRLMRIRTSLLPLFAGGVVGTLVLLVPLLMTLALADGSNRASISLADAEMGSLHPTHLFTLAIPNLFGVIGPDPAYWGAPSVHWPFIVNLFLARNMAMLYLGVLPLIALIGFIGFREHRQGQALFIGLGFLFALLYGLGRYTPFFGWVYTALPGVDLFRRPADATFLIGAMGALVAGFGLDAMLRARLLPTHNRSWCVISVVLLALWGGALALALWLQQLQTALPAIGLAAGFLAFTLVVLIYGRRASPVALTLMVAALLTLDFRINLRPNESTGLPPSAYEVMRIETKNPLIRVLKSKVVVNETRRDRVEFSGLGFHWPNLGLVHGLDSTLGYNPLQLKHFTLATLRGGPTRAPEQRPFGALMPSYRSLMANLLGLRFVLIRAQDMHLCDPNAQDALKLVFSNSEGAIYENMNALPRVMWVPEAQSVDQDALISDPNWANTLWPKADFTALAYVEPGHVSPAAASASGSAKIISYQNTRVEIAVDAPKGGVLVLNDVWHPWWRASIDGVEVPVLRTNAIFRSVLLPEGAKRVVFEFRPFSGLVAQLRKRK